MNNDLVIAIEQYENGELLSRREAVRYVGLENALANALNILLSEAVDAGILPEIEALIRAKAEHNGQTAILDQMLPFLVDRRKVRTSRLK